MGAAGGCDRLALLSSCVWYVYNPLYTRSTTRFSCPLESEKARALGPVLHVYGSSDEVYELITPTSAREGIVMNIARDLMGQWLSFTFTAECGRRSGMLPRPLISPR